MGSRHPGQRRPQLLTTPGFLLLLSTTATLLLPSARAFAGLGRTSTRGTILASRRIAASCTRAGGALLLQRITATTMSASSSTTGASAAPTREWRSLEGLKFDNKAIRELPLDPERDNYIRPVRNAIYSRVQPEPVKNPQLVAVSAQAMGECLDLAPEELAGKEKDVAEYFGGNELLPGSEPYAHCYCGHQFGAFSGQLGDGAAISLGEVVNSKGERWEVQLKGAGPTPYSRRADGRKVLRSSIREFLCSEAMHHLGIPTTRAGAIVTSDSLAQRDIFYNGNVINERCTVVTRLAPTFLRFGSFEIFKPTDPYTRRTGPSEGNESLLRQLLEYAITTYFPHLAGIEPDVERYKAFYQDVVTSTARLVAGWQAVGFTHGVLNTDNMSILGLTIDYGPYGFLDYYDPDFIPNGSDNGGRYTYIKQPEVCRWNLEKFGEALQMVLPLEESRPLLQEYDAEFKRTYEEKMRAKLGLVGGAEDRDEALFKELFATMKATGADFTMTFVGLMSLTPEGSTEEAVTRVLASCASPSVLAASLTKSLRIARPTMPPQQVQQLWALAQTDRAKLGELFGEGNIEAVVEELSGEVEKLERAGALALRIQKLRSEEAMAKREEDAKAWREFLAAKLVPRLQRDKERAGAGYSQEARVSVMQRANPTFVLRNWIAQDAIEAAEGKDFSRVRAVLRLLEDPFDHSWTNNQGGAACLMGEEGKKEGGEEEAVVGRYRGKPTPEWAADLVCTCSS